MTQHQRENHPDYNWINDRSGTRGSACTKPASGKDEFPCKITYIYGKNCFYVFCLNFRLYFRWLKRRLIKYIKFNVFKQI